MQQENEYFPLAPHIHLTSGLSHPHPSSTSATASWKTCPKILSLLQWLLFKILELKKKKKGAQRQRGCVHICRAFPPFTWGIFFFFYLIYILLLANLISGVCLDMMDSNQDISLSLLFPCAAMQQSSIKSLTTANKKALNVMLYWKHVDDGTFQPRFTVPTLFYFQPGDREKK